MQIPRVKYGIHELRSIGFGIGVRLGFKLVKLGTRLSRGRHIVGLEGQEQSICYCN
jgi:hypothetical protein